MPACQSAAPRVHLRQELGCRRGLCRCRAPSLHDDIARCLLHESCCCLPNLHTHAPLSAVVQSGLGQAVAAPGHVKLLGMRLAGKTVHTCTSVWIPSRERLAYLVQADAALQGALWAESQLAQL